MHGDAGETWGLDPERRNRASARLLLRLASRRPTRVGPLNALLRGVHRAVALALGTDFRARDFGEGLFLPHPFGIVVHAGVKIGDRCTIYQHVTLGETNRGPGVPVIGDDVVIGAGAAVLGPVVVGDRARIGANAVVLDDVPAGASAVGVPARVVARPA